MKNIPVAVLDFVSVAFLCAASASAQATFDWTGSAGDGYWTNSLNWSVTAGDDDDGIPDSDDDVWFPMDSAYASGIKLDGERECNSLHYNNNTKFTVGEAGDTLTLTSGALANHNINVNIEHIIACDLRLNAPDGTNQWAIVRNWSFNTPSQQLRIDGKVTTSGIIRFYTNNSGRRGKVVFQSTENSFGGGPFIDGVIVGTDGHEWTEVFGDYPISFGNTGSLFLRNCEQTITNTIDTTCASGTISFFPFGKPLTLVSDIVVPKNATVVFGTSGTSVVNLDPSMTITGAGNMEIMRGAAAFTSVNQFTEGNFLVGNSGGCLIFDGITWEDFSAHYSNGYGTGARQWRLGGGGFASHGQPIIIDGENAATWFNTSFSLGGTGGSTSDSYIRSYSDAPIIIKPDQTITGRRSITSGYDSKGPGFRGTDNPSKLNRFDGSFSGAGGLLFNTFLENNEIVLAGTNNCWTGSTFIQNQYGAGGKNMSLNTGVGGIGLSNGSGQIAIVQFGSPEALPTGNNGADAWLAATARYAGAEGYIVAAKAGGATYTLAPGLRFLLGSNSDKETTYLTGILGATGATGTSATICDSVVCAHSSRLGWTGQIMLLVRGGAECVLGAEGKPLVLAPTYGFDETNGDSGINGAATAVYDEPTSKRKLAKYGDGTLVLKNVSYATQNGTGDTSSQFTWYVGGNSTYLAGISILNRSAGQFLGAIRETGTDIGNSTSNFPVYFCGGVIELDGCDFRRDVSASPTAGQVNLRFGGGFSAHGSDATVELNGGATFVYKDTAGCPHPNYGLIFGSRTADATVNFVNDINLDTRLMKLMAVRGTGDKPAVRLSGQLTNGGLNIMQPVTLLNEPIPAGAIELAHPNNTLAKAIDIAGGTLLVSGAISNGTANVTVKTGGALGGTGIVKRPVVVNEGGTLAAGNLGVGRLTIAGNLSLDEGARIAYEENDGGRDLVALEGGKLTLPSMATIELKERINGKRTLVTGAGSVAGASDLSGWIVEGVEKSDKYYVELVGNDIVLHGMAPGTIFLLR